MAFHARTYAAGEALEHPLIFVLDAAPDGNHVTGPAVSRINGRQNVVEESALVELGVFDVGLKREELPRHFDHVVDVAGFGGAPVNPVAQYIGRAEVFVLAVAAGGEAVMIDDRIPEEARGGAVTLIAGVSVARQVALNLRNLRVAVQPRQDVLPARE